MVRAAVPPTISVVIPTLGRRASLSRCLARLAAQNDRDAELLLVLDAASDRADEVRRALDDHAPLREARLLTAERPGASAARNAGWRAATGDVVLFLDDDVLADPGLLDAHRAVHAERDAIGVGVLGAMRWAEDLRVTPFMRWVAHGVQFDFSPLTARQETGWWHLYTCNCSLRREALARVGGLDETGFPFGYEDLDLGRRVDAAVGGLALVYTPAASAEHEHEMTLEQWRHRVPRIAWSERRFVHRYPDCAPAFHDRFTAAETLPRRLALWPRVAPLVPRGLPYVGTRVHDRAEQYYAQALAREFLPAWDAAAPEADPGPPPVHEGTAS